MNYQKYIQQLINDHKAEIRTKDISDGHHTFGDLYYHRCVLFSVICNKFKDKAWKSKRHHDGEIPFGDADMFIVGIDTPEGSYTYHYHMKYWWMFECEELDKAKEWDGHKPEDIIRLFSLK